VTDPNRAAERLDYEDELYKAGWSDPAWEDPTHPAWAMKLRAERAEAEVTALREEAKGWQAEWTKVVKRERALRMAVLAARPLVDDDEWHIEAEKALA
jgi:hypothetical protein